MCTIGVTDAAADDDDDDDVKAKYIFLFGIISFDCFLIKISI